MVKRVTKKEAWDIGLFSDNLGPEKILQVYDPYNGMKGFVVIDNTYLGPAKGGIRMTSHVSVEEVFRLARVMTLKCALADLPFGGGKAGIIFDEKKHKGKKTDFVKSFSREIKPVCPSEYIAGPDVNTSEKEMKVFVRENGDFHSATGKPLNLCREIHGKETCGLPHEIGSTGKGVAFVTKEALKYKKIDVKGATIAISGFGNVGKFTFKILEEFGAKIVAVSDSKGTLYNEAGINYKEILKAKEKTGSVINGKGKKMSGNKIFEIPVDVLIPAALPDMINKKNMGKVKAKIIIEAGNIPMRLDVEKKLSKKILIVPDFVANAGGVISSYAEYLGKGEKFMEKLVKEKLEKNVTEILSQSLKKKKTPREVATEIALDRLKSTKRKNK